MEKLAFRVELNENQKKMRIELFNRLVKHPLVLSFLAAHHLQASFLEEHVFQLDEWVNYKSKCESCKGLTFCTQEKSGLIKELVYDGFLSFEYVNCEYAKKEFEKNAYQKNYLLFDGSAEMKQFNFASIELENEKKEYKECLMLLINSLNQNKGVYLCGRPGIGKTYLMACLVNDAAHSNKKIAMVNSSKLLSDLKNGFADNSNERMLAILRRVDVLVLDDIGGENVTSWARDEILMPLLNERMEKNKMTCFTSNYTMDELEEHFSVDSRGVKDLIKANRLMERIRTLSIQCVMKGLNRRNKQ